MLVHAGPSGLPGLHSQRFGHNHHEHEGTNNTVCISTQECERGEIVAWVVNYYDRFVPKLSTILMPLTLLLHDGVLWNCSPDCDKRFSEPKGILSGAPELAHYDLKLLLILSCDASPVGVAAMLARL